MDAFLSITKGTLEEGLIYALLAFGVYITYSVLDFPDLSVDGTVPFGAIITGVLIINGVNPWIACIIAFLCGTAAGTITGLLHVKLKIRPLLCGILVMTGLLSINVVIAMKGTDGSSMVSFFSSNTIFNSGIATVMPESIGGLQIRTLVISLCLVILCKMLLDMYFKTKSGLLLRATGQNTKYVQMLSKDPGYSKILGLALGNGFAALAGSVIAQQKSSADQQMGVGMVVIGLASVIIGTSLFSKIKFFKATTAVIFGALAYKAVLAVALELGLPTDYLKLLMAVLLTLALVGNNVLSQKRRKADA